MESNNNNFNKVIMMSSNLSQGQLSYFGKSKPKKKTSRTEFLFLLSIILNMSLLLMLLTTISMIMTKKYWIVDDITETQKQQNNELNRGKNIKDY